MFETEHIEKITQSVLRELEARGVGVERAAVPDVPTGFVLSGVVTQTVLEDSQEAGTVVLASDAIVTPSGREYLQRNNITVSRSTSPVADSAAAGVVLCSVDTPTVLAAAKSAGWSVQNVENEKAIVSAVQSDSPHTVCCVEHPSLVACLLNRNENIRAAVVSASVDLMPLKKIMNPNVVCLSASGWSFTAFLRMLRTMSEV